MKYRAQLEREAAGLGGTRLWQLQHPMQLVCLNHAGSGGWLERGKAACTWTSFFVVHLDSPTSSAVPCLASWLQAILAGMFKFDHACATAKPGCGQVGDIYESGAVLPPIPIRPCFVALRLYKIGCM